MHRFSIGREDDCDVVLDDVRVSRRHAYLTLSPDGSIHFEDFKSTNGSYLIEGDNLVRINSTYLQSDARLQLGKVQISLEEILRKIHAKIRHERRSTR